MGYEKDFKKIKTKPDSLICDMLLDQDLFAGVGNIIKNEVNAGQRERCSTKAGIEEQ